MSLKHILLGLLEEPHSGYEVKAEFEKVFKYFWSAELSQIYPALNKLEEEGLAKSYQQPSVKGPSKRIYSRNKKGERELRKWLTQGPIVGKDRVNYLSQVFFLSDLNSAERRDYFTKLRSHFMGELEELHRIENGWRDDQPEYPDNLDDTEQCKQFTMRLGLKKVSATIEWCDECIEIIEKGEADQ